MTAPTAGTGRLSAPALRGARSLRAAGRGLRDRRRGRACSRCTPSWSGGWTASSRRGRADAPTAVTLAPARARPDRPGPTTADDPAGDRRAAAGSSSAGQSDGTIGAGIVRRPGRLGRGRDRVRRGPTASTATPAGAPGRRRRATASRTPSTSAAASATTGCVRDGRRRTADVRRRAAAQSGVRGHRRPGSSIVVAAVVGRRRCWPRRRRRAASSGSPLRPLRRVAATATRVSELPLDRGEVGAGRAGAGGRHRPAHRGRPGRRRAQPACWGTSRPR